MRKRRYGRSSIKKLGPSSGSQKSLPAQPAPPPPPVAKDTPFEFEDSESDAKQLDEDLESVTTTLRRDELMPGGTSVGNSWDVALKVVKKYRPVPWILWRLVHGVFGKTGALGSLDPITFDLVRPLILNAAQDKMLGAARKPDAPEITAQSRLEDLIKILGTDVAAALCVIHGVCRRISTSLAERIWRPILDDALMRAQIGYVMGENAPHFGRGRGMLAGFSGRSGLSILIAAGDLESAQRALEGLAAGLELREVGLKVYGCDPLQVAAMTLSAAGCSIDAALGIAAYGTQGRGLAPSSDKFRWLSAFAVAEALRMGELESVDERYWESLHFNQAGRDGLKEKIRQLQRKGPSWHWIIPRQEMPEEE